MSRTSEFLSDMDVLLGKALFFSQSRISQIAFDEISATLRLKRFTFPPTTGCYENNGTFAEDVAMFSGLLNSSPKRGNSAVHYSVSHTVHGIPQFARNILTKHKCSIESYLGKGFLYEKAQIWRNFHLPNELVTFDVYSNVWHQDSHDGSRLIKLFVQLQTVTAADGPLTYLDRVATRRHWTELRHRWDFEKMKNSPSFEEERYFTGKPGDYLLFDSSRLMHKAGNPKFTRDIFQITLFPKWRKSEQRCRLDL